MKRNIKYKMYDTSKSQLIGKLKKFLPKKVMNFNKELYKTKNGQFFIYQYHENCMRFENYSYKKVFPNIFLVEVDDIVKWLEEDFKDFEVVEYDKIVEEVKHVLALW